jgi:tetratricopeptide (TPR) repeat protein
MRLPKEVRELRSQAMRNPADDELWGDLGDALRAFGDLGGARGAYLRAYRIDPADSEWQRALVDLGDLAVVVDSLRAGLDESSDESLGDLADMLKAGGQVEEACDLYRRAAELDPADSEWIDHAVECGFEVPEGYATTTDSGNAYYEGGVEGGMVSGLLGGIGGWGLPTGDEVGALTEQLSHDAGLLVKLGQAELRSGDKPHATEHLWQALLVEHTNEEALTSWMVAAGKTRREALEKLRETFSEDDELVGLLADHYLDLGLRDRARDLYELAHQLDEDDPEWEAKRVLLGATP